MARLGVMIEAQEGLDWARWRRITADAERLGFASLRVSDHLRSVMGVDGRTSLQAWVALALAAEWTSRIELAPMVSPMTFYEAGVLARIAVGVDELSGGRLLLGMGAGWNEIEHEEFGVPFLDWKGRFDRLQDAVERIPGLVSRMPGARPLRLLLGGHGVRRSLPLIARHAFEWNGPGHVDVYREKATILDRMCGEIGRDPRDIRRSIMTGVVVGRTRDEVRERASAMRRVLPDLADADVDTALDVLRQRWPVGTPDEVAERLRPLAGEGVELFMLQHFLLDDADHLEVLSTEVAPRLAA